MKTLPSLILGAFVLGVVLPQPAIAAKSDGKKAKLIAKYDKNGNGTHDGGEIDSGRKDFDADKEGEFKAYDKDRDGKLSDDEVQAIKPGAAKKSKAASGEAKPKKEKKSKDGEEAKTGGSTAEDTAAAPPAKEPAQASE